MKQNKKPLLLFFMLTILVFALSHCVDTEVKSNDRRGLLYAGSASCRRCHRSVYDSYVTTAHYSASKPAAKENINGSFINGQNIFNYNADEKVVMEARDSGLFQVAYVKGKEVEAHRFDITFGVKNGQTYLYWNGNRTYELPVSHYSSVKSWGTSPGLSAEHPDFNRFIGKECFECHASYIDSKLDGFSTRVEVLGRNSIVYGIDCERCHGPAMITLIISLLILL